MMTQTQTAATTADVDSSGHTNYDGDDEFPIETTISPLERRLRVYGLAPLAFIQQFFLMASCVQDFVDYAESEQKVAALTVDVHNTTMRFLALGAFFLVILLDLGFIIRTLYRGPRLTVTRFKRLWPICSHHVGFGVLTGRILFQSLEYVYGLAYVALLSEFCFGLRLVLNFQLTAISPIPQITESTNTLKGNNWTNVQQRIHRQRSWQMRLLFLDLFFGGGGTSAAVFIYALILGDESLGDQTKRGYTIIISLAILYWLIQLVSNHRITLERLLERFATLSHTSLGPSNIIATG